MATAEVPPEEAPEELKSNDPPPLEAWTLRVDDLFGEAENWCDGEPIATEAQAEELTKLIGMLEEAAKETEACRAAEKKPHWDAGKAVDAAWKPVTEKCAKALRVAKKAMLPWLEALQAEQRRKAEEARREADEAAARLREQHEAARRSSDLADEDVTETLEAEAKEAAKAAAKLEKEKPVVRGGGKAVTMRDVWLVNITDRKELLRHYMATKPDDLTSWLYEQARKDIRAGARHLPGCSIWSETQAV